MIVMNGKTKSICVSESSSYYSNLLNTTHQWLTTDMSNRTYTYSGFGSEVYPDHEIFSILADTPFDKFTNDFKNNFYLSGMIYEINFEIDYEIIMLTSQNCKFYISTGISLSKNLTDIVTVTDSQKGHLSKTITFDHGGYKPANFTGLFLNEWNIPEDSTLKFTNWKLSITKIIQLPNQQCIKRCVKDIFHDYIIDDDGTVWLHLLHQNRKGSLTYGMFSASGSNIRNTFVYESQDVWSACCLMKNVNHGTNYEFLVTQSANGGNKTRCRWIQSVSPYEGTFATTTHANITAVENIGASYGGMYAWSENNAWCFNNGNNGNWHGCGNRTNWTDTQMIPGYNGMNVTGEQDLYIRVYNIYK